MQARSLMIAFREYLESLEEAIKNDRDPILPLPLTALSKSLKGLRPGEVTMLAGHAGHGKSALAQQIALFIAEEFRKDEGKKRGVVYYTLEMQDSQLVGRAIIQASGFDKDLLDRPKLMEERDWQTLRSLQDSMEFLPIIIEDSGMIETDDIRRDIKTYKQEYDIKLVVVDYFQLLSDPVERGTDEVKRLDHMIKALKDIAKVENLHVLALSSLNSAGEGLLPSNINLRGSRGIAFTADNVCFLHRPRLFNSQFSKDWDSYAMFLVTKARNGPCGTYYLRWDDVYLKFHNCSREEESRLKNANMMGA